MCVSVHVRFQMVVSNRVGAGNWTQLCSKSSRFPNHSVSWARGSRFYEVVDRRIWIWFYYRAWVWAAMFLPSTFNTFAYWLRCTRHIISKQLSVMNFILETRLPCHPPTHIYAPIPFIVNVLISRGCLLCLTYLILCCIHIWGEHEVDSVRWVVSNELKEKEGVGV